ncbi:chaperone modulator CbpM [Acetobacter fallax]|uniref:Chaperone modulatory protein CbpM n=1 Tax=Acetobacter fallax TaxID=1737473 RepID=A0ABX0K8Q4_9PROT|nr:chaperone modulator CbpM [Acetobacter fallax]NHO32611.1 hypothetical protein [Acetobacter fallax]NHO36191.1 hypothetical protein [Acetobacter fallax]
MITIETLAVRLGRISTVEIEGWIEREWLRADGVPGHYVFQEVDEARARLILELRDDLGVEEDAVPVVLSLLDQLYTTRRQMRLLAAALNGGERIAEAGPVSEIRAALLHALQGVPREREN